MTMMMSTMPAITTIRLKIILKVPTMMPTMNALMPKKLIMPNVLPKTIPNPRQMKPTLIETSATWLCAPACLSLNLQMFDTQDASEVDPHFRGRSRNKSHR